MTLRFIRLSWDGIISLSWKRYAIIDVHIKWGVKVTNKNKNNEDNFSEACKIQASLITIRWRPKPLLTHPFRDRLVQQSLTFWRSLQIMLLHRSPPVVGRLGYDSEMNSKLIRTGWLTTCHELIRTDILRTHLNHEFNEINSREKVLGYDLKWFTSRSCYLEKRGEKTLFLKKKKLPFKWS